MTAATPRESFLAQIEAPRLTALYGDDADKVRFAKLVLGAWPTILDALSAHFTKERFE